MDRWTDVLNICVYKLIDRRLDDRVPLYTNETDWEVKCWRIMNLLFVSRGDPVRVLRCLLGVTQDGLSRVTVVCFIQSDVLHDERRQRAPVCCYSASSTCEGTQISGLENLSCCMLLESRGKENQQIPILGWVWAWSARRHWPYVEPLI